MEGIVKRGAAAGATVGAVGTAGNAGGEVVATAGAAGVDVVCLSTFGSVGIERSVTAGVDVGVEVTGAGFHGDCRWDDVKMRYATAASKPTTTMIRRNEAFTVIP
jgi:hypothetical protein